MREFFIFRLTDKESGNEHDMNMFGVEALSPIIEKEKEVGTTIHYASGNSVAVREIRTAIYGMDQFGLFKKTWERR